MNVFIATTPYHLFLTLCFQEYKAPDLIILLDDTYALHRYAALAGSLNFVYVPSGEQVEGKLRRLLRLNRWTDTAYKRLIDHAIDATGDTINSVYVFNDSPPTVQYIIERSTHRRQVIPVRHIEDGTAAYNNHTLPRRIFPTFLKRIFYGTWFSTHEKIGGHPKVLENILLFPKEANAFYRKKKCLQYKSKPNVAVATTPIRKIFEDEGNLFCEGMNNLLLMPRSANSAAAYLSKFELSQKNTMLKLHPLDGPKASEAIQLGISILNPAIPSEIVISSACALERVYTSCNTSALACIHFFPRIRLIFFEDHIRDPASVFEQIRRP